METIVYHTLKDKEKLFGDGPWCAEPDKMQWLDEETGFPCLAVRQLVLGHWCGYVGVPRDHPYYGKNNNDCDVSVHGGLTFSDKCTPGPESETICHIVDVGEDDDVWWLGFDCAHAFDLSPSVLKFHAYRATLCGIELAYRDLAYVREECRKLAAQLEALR